MKVTYIRYAVGCAALILAGSFVEVAIASPGTLRIASYNIDSQDQNSDNNITQSTGATAHSIPTVIQAIGNHYIGSNAQPVDVLGLEEMLTSTTGGVNNTLKDLSTQLNNIYGAGTYSFDAANQTQAEGLIYDTKTVQIVSVRVLPTGSNVLLQSNGTYTAAHEVSGGQTVPRAPMLYQLRPVGYGSNADYYMYVSHARSTSDNSVGDARYAEAQEVRSDAKYNLPANAHIIYSGDWNLFNGSAENAYKCLTGQATSDSINWGDSSAVWANSKATQGFDPTSKTSPATTTTWSNSSSDGSASYLYTDSTDAGTFANSSRIDVQLVNSPMLNLSGLQLAPDTSDPHDARNFPSSQYPYAFETFGNNGSTPRGGTATNSFNNSLQDLANASTVLADLQRTGSGSSFTGSDHYPIVGDYALVGISPLGITWNGGGSTNNWSTAANWTSALSNGSSLTFAGTTRLSNSNDSLTSVGSITFDNTAGAFVLSGNALTTSGDITNNSTSGQTIGINLTLGSAQQFNAASGAMTFNGTVANGGNLLTVTGSSTTTLGSTVSGAGGLAKTGAGTLMLNGSNSYSGGTTVTAGTVQLGNASGLGSNTAGLTVNTGGTLDLHGFSSTTGGLNGTGGAIQSNIAGAVSLTAGNGGASGSYAGTIANGLGTVSFIKTGAGSQTLSGNNTYSGGTTVSGGTLQMGHVNALGSNTAGVTVNTGGTLDLHGFSPAVGGLNGSGGAVQSNVGGAVSFTVGNGGAGGSYAGTVVDGSGTVGLIKTGAGSQTLSGNNTYSGGTTVSGGTLQMGHVNALGSNTAGVTVNTGGTLDLHGFSPAVGGLNGSGGAVQSNVAGAVSLTMGNGGAGGSYAGTVVDGSGTVGLIKTGAGTQTLSGNNSYSGGTTVSGGTLQMGHANALGANTAGVTVNTGGTLDLHGFSPTVGGLNGSGGAVQSNVAGAVTFTLGNGGAGGSYAGTVVDGSGTVGVIKTGAGTQTLSGNNTYSGGTTVNTGTLVAGHVNALGTSGLTINNSALTRLQAGLSGPVQLPSLTMAGGATPTATLDITDNNLIVHNGNLATLAAQAAHAATANLDWTGTGLTSTTARDDANLVTAVGVIQNDDGSGSPLYATWPAGADSGGAVAVSLTDVLVKYTYYGDADLDGVVNASFDYDLWSAGFAGAGTGWEFGDFDYSGGFANSSIDYDLWAAGNAASAGSPLSGGVQPVPEPSTLVLVAFGLLSIFALKGRRRPT